MDKEIDKMGTSWPEQDSQERAQTLSIRENSRKAVLWAALVAAGLLFAVVADVGRNRTNDIWVDDVWLWGMLTIAFIAVFFCFMSWLKARRYDKRKASELGVTDPLTGLPNRRGLMTQLETLDVTPQEFGKRVRLVDVDLANLNRVNYEYGQPVGDAVLQDLANLLRTNSPPDSVVGRLGGDEFLIVVPQASQSEAEALAQTLREAIANYRLSLGERGEVESLKARVSVAAYVPDQASLHETVITAKQSTAHGKLPGGEEGEGEAYYHVPRVTLGTFAVHRWQDLDKDAQSEFKTWKQEMTAQPTDRMANEVFHLLDERADSNWVDFVTAVPAASGIGGGRTYPARRLAERVANLIGVPYRDVMRADASGPESRTIEPAVDAMIEKGDGVLVISDVISSGIVERRCVKKLSAAGAHVQVVAYAAY
jgi:diguanylate cyclase (GGDEF)-like protein